MGNSNGIPASALTEVASTTSFEGKELQRIRRRFQRMITPGASGMNLEQFCSLPELKWNPLAARLFQELSPDEQGLVSFQKFCLGLDRLRSIRTREDKIKYFLTVHDRDGDGKISGDELRGILHAVSADLFGDIQLEKVMRAMMRRHDADNDAKLSFTEFDGLVRKSCPKVA